MARDKENLKRWYSAWYAKRKKKYFDEMGGKCVKCGATENLEFDHIDPSLKLKSYHHAIWSYREERIREEMTKCQLLCHDCHAKKTGAQNTKVPGHGTRHGYDRGCRCEDCCSGKRNSIYAWREKVGGRTAKPRYEPS